MIRLLNRYYRSYGWYWDMLLELAVREDRDSKFSSSGMQQAASSWPNTDHKTIVKSLPE